jgi:hypothetical protein
LRILATQTASDKRFVLGECGAFPVQVSSQTTFLNL